MKLSARYQIDGPVSFVHCVENDNADRWIGHPLESRLPVRRHAGLKTCTRSRAMAARRRIRISSSDLPENIGPATTSIQPEPGRGGFMSSLLGSKGSRSELSRNFPNIVIPRSLRRGIYALKFGAA